MTPPRDGLGPGDDAACVDYDDAHDADCGCPECAEQRIEDGDEHDGWGRPGPEVAWWIG